MKRTEYRDRIMILVSLGNTYR